MRGRSCGRFDGCPVHSAGLAVFTGESVRAEGCYLPPGLGTPSRETACIHTVTASARKILHSNPVRHRGQNGGEPSPALLAQMGEPRARTRTQAAASGELTVAPS